MALALLCLLRPDCSPDALAIHRHSLRPDLYPLVEPDSDCGFDLGGGGGVVPASGGADMMLACCCLL